MDAKKLIEKAEKDAKSISYQTNNRGRKEYKVTTSQIRNIFGRIKTIQTTWKESNNDKEVFNKIILLKPKFAYIDKRVGRGSVLEKTLNPIIDAIKEDDIIHSLKTFFSYMEALVCYHKKYSKN